MDIQPHIFFFPFMAHGHMIPTIEMAKIFASRGCRATIISTPANAPNIVKSIERSRQLDLEIGVVLIKFPSKEVGLPEGYENINSLTTIEMMDNLFVATTMLEQPLEQLLLEHRPTCLVADVFFPWANQIAAKFGIPRLVFHGTSFFALCADTSLFPEEPQKKVSSDSEPFVIPNLPDEIKITRQKLPDFLNKESELSGFARQVEESELTSFGIIVNSYYELEPAYADHYRNFLGMKAWHIGPTFLCSQGKEEKAPRGQESSIDEHECLKWLDSKKPNSVVYVCFGSVANFDDAQLMEIAMGLEASGKEFIWVVKKEKHEERKEEDWLPEGFEKRMEGKGLIIRGWAPQVVILPHEAVGGFVTHCGWNSTLEGICAGLAMVTWPVAAEQFYNEKLVTQILRIGVGVGVEKWARLTGDSVKREAIEKAVNGIMEGEEAEEMRSRAKALGVLASEAVKEGGSSFTNLTSLIEELKLQSTASDSNKD
ncbi:probable UDP-glucosyl transferase 73B6 [Ziziphus jujuba]|uniref:Probable UDP-glucosyl transferase 73B6 n=1 Tax=Ziziphus jujuba TaxID=326968 RepID=A0ABM3IXQ0_ZIZJJ|nr:probable UDP-glucosyl transferase 73B6 [Ziziphus jujuba]